MFEFGGHAILAKTRLDTFKPSLKGQCILCEFIDSIYAEQKPPVWAHGPTEVLKDCLF